MGEQIDERTRDDRAVARVLVLAHEALRNAENRCRYHGDNWDFLGREGYGPQSETEREPRCDSCKQPWRVTRALDAIGRWTFAGGGS